MQLSLATTFIASTAIFFPSNANASLRGVGREFDLEESLEITEDRTGTFLRAYIDYEEGSIQDGPSESFNIMVDGLIYEIDDVNAESAMFEWGRFKSGEAVTIPRGVTLAKSGTAKMNGAKLKPWKEDKQGKNKKKMKNLFDRKLEERTEEQQRNVDQLRRQLSSNTLGDKTVVAVRVQTIDADNLHSEEVLRREIFGIASSDGQGDNFNLSSGYDQCSYGSLTFSPLTSHSGTGGVSIENGVVTVSVDVAAEGNNNGVVRNAVTNKLKTIFGDDLKSVSDYWMYCFPPGTNSGWIGYGYINSHLSVYNKNACTFPSITMHEIGHNLGFAHSGEGTKQYDDRSGIMGFSYNQDEGPVMCFNSAKSWQSGWYGPAGAHGDKTLEYSFGEGCLVETLSGIADYETTSNKVLVKVVNPDGSGADIFVAFNAKKEINRGSTEAGNQVTVVQVNGGGGLSFSKSNLLGKLISGANYTNSNFGGESLTVEVNSISGSDSADVKIYFGSNCIVTSPTNPPTHLPTAEPSNPPSNQPTAQPTLIPTSSPTPQPSKSPTTAPSKSPTPFPTKQPTDTPTKKPTAQPTALPSHKPSASPSAYPSSSPSATPSVKPSDSPSANPSTSPTSTPEMTKTLVCGRGDIADNPCVEGLKRTVPIDEMHEVRCCRDCTGINCSYPWKRQCSAFDSNLYARSKVQRVCKVGTFSEALDFCRNASNDGNSRLCTPLEVQNSCAKGTGCLFDQEQIWSCAYDGHTCQVDADCCGTCVNGTCQGEFSLFP